MIDIKMIEYRLLELMEKAKKENEVPIAAIIVNDNKIIAEAYNKVNSSNNILDHAEILVIKEASNKLSNWRLNNCDLYVSLEPCSMCREIINKSRINKVIYFSKQNNEVIINKTNYSYIENNTISQNLTDFFKEKR